MLDPNLVLRKAEEVLRRYRGFIVNSRDGSWSGMSQCEIMQDIDIAIGKISDRSIQKCDLIYLTTPTGHMQDFAIANGRGDQFNEMATELESIYAHLT